MHRSYVLRLILIVVLLGVSFLTAKYLFTSNISYRSLNTQTGWSYLRGYCIGMAFAREELRSDTAVIIMTGDNWLLDRETGLNIWSTGCCPDKGMEGYIRGYNLMVHRYIRRKGYPLNSRKKWEDVLFNLNSYFDKRAQSERPMRLSVNGPPIVAPDGKTLLYLKSRKDFPGFRYDMQWEPDRTCSLWPISPQNNCVECFLGPPGSDLILFRGVAEHQEEKDLTGAFDMRTGFWLQFDKEREIQSID
jgi:hypothetical protein